MPKLISLNQLKIAAERLKVAIDKKLDKPEVDGNENQVLTLTKNAEGNLIHTWEDARPATKTDLGEVVIGDGINVDAAGTISTNAETIAITDVANNFAATNIEGALAELFQSVSNGKTLIASAITDMGVDTSNTDTFEQMAINIRNIINIRIPCTSITLDKDTLELSMSSSQVNLLDGVSYTESMGDYNFSVTLDPGNYILTNINGGTFTYLGVRGIGENSNVTDPYAFTIAEKATYTVKCEPHGDTIDKIALYKEGLTSGSQSYQLTATVLPADCTDPVVWSVSPEGVATVIDGLVTLIADGTCTVTATCGDKSATCVVNPITSSYPSQFASAIYDISNNSQHWTVFGDSISTTYNISENEIWHNLITADSEFPNITKVNNSLTGSEVSDGGRTIDSFVERYTNLPTNTNLITIFAGVNDWAHNNIPLGNYNDVTTSRSFYGALNTLLPGMKNKCPNARIIWLSPLKTKSNMAVEHTNADGTNTLGLRLTDYIQAIKYKCHQYNVEFVDLYGVTGLDPDVDTGNFQSDGLHPNANGQAALRDYLLNVATVSVPTDEYINEIETDVKFPAIAKFNSLRNNNTAYFCAVVDVSSLNDGDTVVASWTGTEASVWNSSFNNYADPWYSKNSELKNVASTSDSFIAAKGGAVKLTGDLLEGTSTTVISSPGEDFKYLRIQIPINNPRLPGTWTISDMKVTANGTTNLPILNMGGFFTDSDIVMTYDVSDTPEADYVTDGLSLYLDSSNPANTTTVLADMSGNGNDFTAAKDITTNDDGRVVLDGTQCFSNTSYQPHTTTDDDFTFEFFGDITSTGGRNYFFSYSNRNGFSWDEQQGLSGQMGSGDLIWPGTDTVAGKDNRIAPTFGEKHVIITKNGTTYSIYVDGALVQSVEYTTSWSASYNNFRLFTRYNTSNHLNGAMKLVRWYTKGFTAVEVLKNYNSAVPPKPESISMTWEEGTLSSSDGTESASTTDVRTNFIPIDPNGTYIMTNTNSIPGTSMRILAYDTNKNFIGSFGGNNGNYVAEGTTNYTIPNIPSNAAYIRFSANKQSSTVEAYNNTPKITLVGLSIRTIYTVTNNLTNITNLNTLTTLYPEDSYNARLIADKGYGLDAVTVTMGGTDITNTVYLYGNINIPSVTGDIVITASGVEVIQLTPNTLIITDGNTRNVTVSGNKGTVSWETSDPNIATVVNGVITPVNNGVCDITATSNGESAICKVIVTEGEVTLTSYNVRPEFPSLVEIVSVNNNVATCKALANNNNMSIELYNLDLEDNTDYTIGYVFNNPNSAIPSPCDAEVFSEPFSLLHSIRSIHGTNYIMVNFNSGTWNKDTNLIRMRVSSYVGKINDIMEWLNVNQTIDMDFVFIKGTYGSEILNGTKIIPATEMIVDTDELIFNNSTPQKINVALKPSNTTFYTRFNCSDGNQSKSKLRVYPNGECAPRETGSLTLHVQCGDLIKDIPVTINSVDTYTITNNLTNVTNSETNTSATRWLGYSCDLRANDGYTLNNVTVTMGGVDVTNKVYYSGRQHIGIKEVTGDIVITATAI